MLIWSEIILMALAAYAGAVLIADMKITEGLRTWGASSKVRFIAYFAGVGWICRYCTGLQLALVMWIALLAFTPPESLTEVFWRVVSLGAVTGLLWIAIEVMAWVEASTGTDES